MAKAMMKETDDPRFRAYIFMYPVPLSLDMVVVFLTITEDMVCIG